MKRLNIGQPVLLLSGKRTFVTSFVLYQPQAKAGRVVFDIPGNRTITATWNGQAWQQLSDEHPDPGRLSPKAKQEGSTPFSSTPVQPPADRADVNKKIVCQTTSGRKLRRKETGGTAPFAAKAEPLQTLGRDTAPAAPLLTSAPVAPSRETITRTPSAPRCEAAPIRKCRVCGCTDDDCSVCIAKTGQPCHWIGLDLCSACQTFPAITHSSAHKSRNDLANA